MGACSVSGYACEGWDANCRMNIDATHFVNNHNSFVVKYDQGGVVERLSVMNGNAADYLQVMVEVDDHRVLLAGNHYSSTLYAGNFSVFNSGGLRCLVCGVQPHIMGLRGAVGLQDRWQ